MSITGQLMMPISVFMVFWLTEYVMSTFFGMGYLTYKIMYSIAIGAMMGYVFRPILDESLERDNK